MEDERLQKATKTLGGAKAGLSSAREMKEEAKKLKEKEERSFQNVSDILFKNGQMFISS